MMATEIRYCKNCRCDRRHDVYKDGLTIGEKASGFERAFFAVFTLGGSELAADYWRKCQACGRKERK